MLAWALARASAPTRCAAARAWAVSAAAAAAWASASSFSRRASAMSPVILASRSSIAPPTRGAANSLTNASTAKT